MKTAFLRLFIIAGIAIVIIGGVLTFVRYLGQVQEFAPLKHPILQNEYLVIADGGDTRTAPPQSSQALTSLKSSCESCIPKVDLRRTLDGKWYLYPQNDLKELTNGEGYFSLQSSKTIDKLNFFDGSSVLSLKSYLNQFPDRPTLFVIHTRDASQASELLKEFEGFESAKTLMFHSPYKQILKDLRKERPLWLFGIAPTEITQILMMEALHIETMADIWSDLFISTLRLSGGKVFTDRMVIELKRRYKPIILEAEENLDLLPEILKENLHGVITTRYLEAEQFFQRRGPSK